MEKEREKKEKHSIPVNYQQGDVNKKQKEKATVMVTRIKRV